MGVGTHYTKKETTSKTNAGKTDGLNDPLLTKDDARNESPVATKSVAAFPVDKSNQCPTNGKAKDVIVTSGKKSDGTRLQSSSTTATTTATSSSTSIPSLQFHIHILYAITVCLNLLFASAGLVWYLQISSLKQEISRQKTITSQLVVDINVYKNTNPVETRKTSASVLFTPYHKDYFKFQKKWDAGVSDGREGDPDKHGGKRRNKRTAPSNHGNVILKAEYDGGGGHAEVDGEDWLWMRSYTRVPMVALKSYCKEAQLYCSAGGKPGSPGPKGDRGEDGRPGFDGPKGDKGEKGGLMDASAIAQNIANGVAVQGPPGPKGDRGSKGERGLPGERGRSGKDGRHGIDGQNGLDGTQGSRGAKGDPGKRGLLGFPGLKGDAGPVGPRGPKGERGMRGIEGLDGPKGERGYTGSRGERGISGLPGVPGMKGLKGNPGRIGYKGERGRDGLKGLAGHCEYHCITNRKPTTALYTANAESVKGTSGAIPVHKHSVGPTAFSLQAFFCAMAVVLVMQY